MNIEGKASRRQKAAKERARADIKAALEHAPTRRLLGQVFDMTGIYDLSAYDATSLSIAAGRREVGLRLRLMIDDADPLAFVAIEAEAINRKRDDAALAEREKQRDADAPDMD